MDNLYMLKYRKEFLGFESPDEFLAFGDLKGGSTLNRILMNELIEFEWYGTKHDWKNYAIALPKEYLY